MKERLLIIIVGICLYLPSLSLAFVVGDVFDKVQRDLLALTRRVTARHILVSNDEVALTLKRKIRDQAIQNERYVIDVFEEAAKKYSQDDTTKFRGGLIGELVPQGYYGRSSILDRACFEVSLGTLEGPIQSELGYHLLLVSERTNCPKLDGKKTKLIQLRGDDIFGTRVEATQVGKTSMAKFALDQIQLWVLVLLAGGLVAELAAKVGSI